MDDSSPLTPEQDAVRHLLADARHDGPTPPAVVTRLDEVLASLVAERGEAPLPSESDSTSAAVIVDPGLRRRRMAGIGLLAAAAVVVAGVAVGQVLPRTSGSHDAGSAAGDASTSDSRDFSDDGGGSDAGSGTSEKEMAPQTKQGPSALPTLSAADPQLDQALIELRPTAPARSDALGQPEALTGCGLRDPGRGRRVDAVVDGRPGVVVFRRPSGDAQDVAIFVCGTPAPVRTLTLPAP